VKVRYGYLEPYRAKGEDKFITKKGAKLPSHPSLVAVLPCLRAGAGAAGPGSSQYSPPVDCPAAAPCTTIHFQQLHK
jgi:hypothetical protein